MTHPGWDRALRALDVLASDPAAVGGLWLRARSGPARTAFLARLDRMLPGLTRLHPDVSDEALFGGLDLAATLAAGRVVKAGGLLSRPGSLVLTMAERCPPRPVGAAGRGAGWRAVADRAR